jgi:hypothetical protein
MPVWTVTRVTTSFEMRTSTSGFGFAASDVSTRVAASSEVMP